MVNRRAPLDLHTHPVDQLIVFQMQRAARIPSSRLPVAKSSFSNSLCLGWLNLAAPSLDLARYLGHVPTFIPSPRPAVNLHLTNQTMLCTPPLPPTLASPRAQLHQPNPTSVHQPPHRNLSPPRHQSHNALTRHVTFSIDLPKNRVTFSMCVTF